MIDKSVITHSLNIKKKSACALNMWRYLYKEWVISLRLDLSCPNRILYNKTNHDIPGVPSISLKGVSVLASLGTKLAHN